MGGVYDFFSARMVKLGFAEPSSTFKNDGYLEVFDAFFDKVYERYPKDKHHHCIVLNENPDDVERSEIMMAETEEIVFTDYRIKCEVCMPECLTLEMKLELKLLMENQNVIIYSRFAATLTQQYELLNIEESFLYGNLATLVFIRLSKKLDGQKQVTLIPFTTPEKLMDFYESVLEGGEIISCISTGSFFDDLYIERWSDTLSPVSRYILNDVSLLYLLEHLFNDYTNISYTQLSFRANNKIYTSIVFQVFNGEDDFYFITPLTAYAVGYFLINKKVSCFPNNLKLIDPHLSCIEKILINVFSEEHSWLLRTAFVVSTLNSSKK